MFYQAGDLMNDTGSGSTPDDERKDEAANVENQGEDDPMESEGDKVSEIDLDALERDLLEYEFNEIKTGEQMKH